MDRFATFVNNDIIGAKERIVIVNHSKLCRRLMLLLIETLIVAEFLLKLRSLVLPEVRAWADHCILMLLCVHNLLRSLISCALWNS